MPSEYVTQKTDVAAFLLAKGHVVEVKRDSGDVCYFVFPPDAAADAAAYERNAAIPARQFARARFDLMALIAQAKGEPVNPSINPSRKESVNANARRS